MTGSDNNSPKASSSRPDTSAGEAALQLTELILFVLIDRKLIDRDELVADIENLAAMTPDVAPAQLKTLKARLSELANSISACDRPESIG
jgi:hypothetical protein